MQLITILDSFKLELSTTCFLRLGFKGGATTTLGQILRAMKANQLHSKKKTIVSFQEGNE
jgi:hypothetical protein